MPRLLLTLFVFSLLISLAGTADADHGRKGERLARRFAATRSWHAAYYHTEWGQPLALVVPPTARMGNSWAWGVAQSEMRPLYHQYQRNYPGAYEASGQGFYPTPIWPSHTDQFGVYYIRGPW